jgi:hypothetical protein
MENIRPLVGWLSIENLLPQVEKGNHKNNNWDWRFKRRYRCSSSVLFIVKRWVPKSIEHPQN